MSASLPSRGTALQSGIVFFLLLLLACAVTRGTPYTFTDGAGTGAWSSAGNWSTGTVPGNGADVAITGGPSLPVGSGWAVTYDYTGAAVSLNSITISHSNAKAFGTSNSLTMGAGTSGITVLNSENIGDSGSKGYGTFNQSGSSNSFVTLDLGVNATDSGTYNLSGTGYMSGPYITVGDAGFGTFNETGGSVNLTSTQYVNATLNLGNKSGGNGTYNLSGGVLSLIGGGENIGVAGVASFVQTGGTNQLQYYGEYNAALTIGATGSYTLGDTATLTGVSHYNGTDVSGVSEFTSGTFNQTGGSNQAVALTIAAGTYSLSGDGSLSVDADEIIGSGGASATFTQNGGQHYVYGNLTLGYDSGSSGSYTLESGSLGVSGNQTIGSTGTGSFANSGGIDNAYKSLSVNPTGTYTLSDTGTLNAGSEYINGTFIQTSGTHTAGNGSADFSSGLNVNGGNYQLSGGSLAVEGYELVSAGGSMIQTGGTNMIGTSGAHQLMAVVGDVTGSTTGTYSLSNTASLTVNGALHVGGITETTSGQTQSISAGAGVLNISGGTLVVTDFVKLWNSAGSAINFSAGAITTPELDGDATNFNWTGGTLNLTASGGAIIGTGGFFQTLTMNPGMTLNTASLTIATGGTLIPNGGNTNYSGPLMLTGGTLKAGSSQLTNASQIVGYGAIAGSTGFTNSGAVTVPIGTLNLSNTGAISNSGTVILSPATQFKLTGGNLANTGLISLNGGAISGTAILNNNSGGVLSGYGTISATLANNAGANLLVQTGSLNLIQPMTNNGTIDLAGPAASLFGATITNKGIISFTGGFTSIHNPLSNNTASFIRVSSDSIADFENAVTGSAVFSGAGLKMFGGGASNSITTLATVSGDTVIEPGATLTLNSFNENSMNIQGNAHLNPGGFVSQTNSLSIASTGILDLANDSLFITYSVVSPAQIIRGYLHAGYNAGNWNGVGGINSSIAASTKGATLGYSDNASQILIKYTWAGDANLDGNVNASDLSMISPTGKTWQTGDFNYDDKVNADDYALFALGVAASSGANISTTLPEPAIMECGLLGFILLRRKNPEN